MTDFYAVMDARKSRPTIVRNQSQGTTSNYGAAALERELGRVATAPEGTRNDTLNRAAFALGQLMAGGEVDETTATDQLTTAARRAGLDDTEITQTIGSGIKAGKLEPRTSEKRAKVPEPTVIDGEDETRNALSNIKTGQWLDAQHFPPLRWAIPGLIPEGFGLITGAPKIGKSWATLDLALAVASGTKALGAVDAGEPKPVLLLALEDGDRRLQARARKLLGNAPIPPMLHYATQATPAEVMEMMDAWLEVHGHQAPLIVLDTLGKVMPPALPGEGAYARDYRIGGQLKSRADSYPGSSLLVVHHTRKAGSEDWMDSTSGTNGLNGAADYTIALTRARNEAQGTLRVTGRDVPEGTYALTISDGCWQLDGGNLEVSTQIAATREASEGLGDTSAEIVSWVNQQTGPVRAKDVAEALGISDHTARTYLARVAEAGRIAKQSRGLYTPVATVASVASEREPTPNATHATHATPPLGDALATDRANFQQFKAELEAGEGQ